MYTGESLKNDSVRNPFFRFCGIFVPHLFTLVLFVSLFVCLFVCLFVFVCILSFSSMAFLTLTKLPVNKEPLNVLILISSLFAIIQDL